MNTEERRVEIINILSQNNDPIKGTQIAKKFGVSRQVIVQDIAILRAEGLPVMATPNGYIIVKNQKNDLIKEVAVRHSRDNTNRELEIMLDYGARILDVIVEHPIYGEIKGVLNINSKSDLDNFTEKLLKSDIEPLSVLTDGVHIHTIEVPNIDTFKEMIAALREEDFLV